MVNQNPITTWGRGKKLPTSTGAGFFPVAVCSEYVVSGVEVTRDNPLDVPCLAPKESPQKKPQVLILMKFLNQVSKHCFDHKTPDLDRIERYH